MSRPSLGKLARSGYLLGNQSRYARTPGVATALRLQGELVRVSEVFVGRAAGLVVGHVVGVELR